MKTTVNRNHVTIVRAGAAPEPPVIVEKLAKFEGIADDVLANFPFVQDVHGQRRFTSFPIEATVHYLHALWICDCKDMLLSVPNLGRRRKGSHDRFERYEGQRALELLAEWQEGRTADVISFLELKLDYAPFRQITRSFDEAARNGDTARMRRLAHGRNVLLNRARNLERALTAIFALSADRLVREVRAACAVYGHTIEQCARQLAEMREPEYEYIPHPALARRNMLLMNALGVTVTDNSADRPGHRTPTVQAPTMPQPGYAEHVVDTITMVDLPLEL
jgi:hypothetical protein